MTLLSLVRDPGVRSRLPSLEAFFGKLDLFNRAAIAAAHPDPYFLPLPIEAMRSAGSWRTAEQLAEQVVVPYGPLMSVDQLREVLEAWWGNFQCRAGSRMPGLAAELYAATSHLGLDRRPVWEEFVREVRTRAEPHELPYYSYSEVEQAIIADGGQPITP